MITGCPKCKNQIISISAKKDNTFQAVCEQCGYLYTSPLSRVTLMDWLQKHCEIEAKGTVTNPRPEHGLVGGKAHGTVRNPDD